MNKKQKRDWAAFACFLYNENLQNVKKQRLSTVRLKKEERKRNIEAKKETKRLLGLMEKETVE